LLENIMGLEEVFGKEAKSMSTAQRDILTRTSSLINDLYASIKNLRENKEKVNARKTPAQIAEGYGEIITPITEELGEICTKMEGLIDNEIWPLPKFQELLFTR